MFDKLKFWKGSDDSSLSNPSIDLGGGQLSDDPMRRGTDPLQDGPSDPLQHQSTFDSPQGPLEGSFDGQAPSGPTDYPQGANPFTNRSSMLPPDQNVSGQYEVHHAPTGDREMELILAKLDAIKSELDSLHQRVRNIEERTDSKAKQRYW